MDERVVGVGAQRHDRVDQIVGLEVARKAPNSPDLGARRGPGSVVPIALKKKRGKKKMRKEKEKGKEKTRKEKTKMEDGKNGKKKKGRN